MRRSQLHHEFQRELFRHRDLLKGQYPALKALYAVPNGGLRHPAVGKMLKAEGATAGVWDCNLPVPRVYGFAKGDPSPAHFPPLADIIGLWIEIKTGRDKLSPEQIAWRDLLEPYGHEFYVARDMMETLNYIKAYLGG
jgi:hypothetical protein